MEVEAVEEGVVEELLVPEGTENVKVNAPIARLAGEGAPAASPQPPPPAAAQSRVPARRSRSSRPAATRSPPARAAQPSRNPKAIASLPPRWPAVSPNVPGSI